MAAEPIKFDVNAGACLLPDAREAMVFALDLMANASAVHRHGRAARTVVDQARSNVAELLGVGPEQVVFTSGATEAACTALSPIYQSGRDEIRVSRLFVGATEHPCVLQGGRFHGTQITQVPVEPTGEVDLSTLEENLMDHDRSTGRPLVAMMLANNETGVLHPIKSIVDVARRFDAILFCDAVQAIGRLPVDLKELDVDVLAISSHKIGGPQGAGALVLKDQDLIPRPLLTGGGQERYRRAGTENIAAIAGFGAACMHVKDHLKQHDQIEKMRNKVQDGITTISRDVRFFGAEARRLPNTLLFAVPGIAAETAVIALDLEGVAVSSGSACSSGKVTESHVIRAMGADSEAAKGGIRISLPWSVKENEVDRFLSVWADLADRLVKRKAA